MHNIRIDIVENEGYNITNWSFTDPTGTNNMSTPDKVFNFEGAPYRGFHFSKNYQENTIQFAGGYGFYPTTKYSGYISASMSDSTGALEADVTLALTLSAIPKYLLINFDPAQGVMATNMTINGIAVTNSSYSMVVQLQELGITTTSISIVFTKLNKPYNPLKITAVIPGLISTFSDRYIQSVTFASQLMDTSFNITPAVVEQYARLVLIDRSGIITNIAESADMAKDLKVMLYIDNVLKYTYLTSIWDIQAESSKITLECNDPSKKLANCQISATGISSRSLYELFQIAFTFTGYTFEAIDNETEAYLHSMIVKNSFTILQTSLELINKLCVVGFLRVFWDKNIFKIARCY